MGFKAPQEEEEELAQIPAEARLLYLLLNDPGIADEMGWKNLVVDRLWIYR